jgi:protein-S-isoprenylcysteine O-methyltransferase Ste14
LYLAWGAAFKHLTLLTVVLALAATIFLVMTARREEVENIHYFGEAYQEYMTATKLFIPFIF